MMNEQTKRGKGKPPLPLGVRKDRRTIRIDANLWAWCKRQGDASEYIRGLIDADRARKEEERVKRNQNRASGVREC